MSTVNIINVNVLENPSPFLSNFKFEITFECMEDLQEGNSLNKAWKVKILNDDCFRLGVENNLRRFCRKC